MFHGYKTWSDDQLWQWWPAQVIMMTFMEVKGHMMTCTIGDNYVPWLQNLVRRSVMTMMTCTGHHDDLHGGQRSYGSNIVTYVPWLQNLVRRSVMTMMTCTGHHDDLHGGQRSYDDLHNWGQLCSMATKLGQTISYDNDDLHRSSWWPSWRSKVIWVKYSKLCSMATKLGQTISYDNDDLHRGQRSTEVRCVNLCYMATTFGQIYG